MKTLFALALLLFSAGNATAGIVFEKTVVTVPCAIGQNIVTAEIPFKVEGTATLSVTQIRTGCDCTVAEADAPEYAPGKTGKIKIKFTAGERTGRQNKTITVKTSDGREAVAFFRTNVPRILAFTPAFVFWKKNETPAAKEIEVKIVTEKQINITGFVASPEGVFAVELKTLEPGKRHTLKITPKDTASPVTARIVLKTDFPKDTTERFVIVAAVK